jgi:hypothetical protein
MFPTMTAVCYEVIFESTAVKNYSIYANEWFTPRPYDSSKAGYHYIDDHQASSE